jgi:hypothetical protein
MNIIVYHSHHTFLSTPVQTEGRAGPEPNMVQGGQEEQGILTGQK